MLGKNLKMFGKNFLMIKMKYHICEMMSHNAFLRQMMPHNAQEP